MKLLFLALAACTPDPKDSDDTGDTGTPPSAEVGEVFDLGVDAQGVVAELPTAGTYVVVLFSQAEERDTLYGYGSEAKARPQVDLPDPLPVRGGATAPESALLPGSRRTFTVWNGERAVDVEGELIELTEELILWRDVTTENPLGDIEEETLEEIVETFEAIVLPRTRQIFGEISDVEGSKRIDVLISYTVNQYGAVAYVSTCDIGDLYGCGGWGNGSEIIYMGIPDPESSYSSANAIVEIWAHELNHLVYGWHKYILNGQLSAEENIYLTEGFSELAQDLTGFNNGNQYIWASAIDMRDFYEDEDYSTQGISINDVLRGSGYYDALRDGPLRGAAYLFLRYLFEQAGGMLVDEAGGFEDAGGMTWLQTWFDAPELGVDCVEATTGRDLLDLAMDWYTALVVTGREINDDPVYNYQEREQDPLTTYEFGVDPYATIHGWLTLNGPPVQPLETADGWIRAGGVEYLQVTVSEPGTVSIPVDPAALPRARALRIE